MGEREKKKKKERKESKEKKKERKKERKRVRKRERIKDRKKEQVRLDNDTCELGGANFSNATDSFSFSAIAPPAGDGRHRFRFRAS